VSSGTVARLCARLLTDRQLLESLVARKSSASIVSFGAAGALRSEPCHLSVLDAASLVDDRIVECYRMLGFRGDWERMGQELHGLPHWRTHLVLLRSNCGRLSPATLAAIENLLNEALELCRPFLEPQPKPQAMLHPACGQKALWVNPATGEYCCTNCAAETQAVAA